MAYFQLEMTLFLKLKWTKYISVIFFYERTGKAQQCIFFFCLISVVLSEELFSYALFPQTCASVGVLQLVYVERHVKRLVGVCWFCRTTLRPQHFQYTIDFFSLFGLKNMFQQLTWLLSPLSFIHNILDGRDQFAFFFLNKSNQIYSKIS